MKKTIHVLMVEDSEDYVLLMVGLLEKDGWEPKYLRVDTAGAMRAALKEKSWDIVICDYGMPRFNGLEAIAVLREAALEIPIILVSDVSGEDKAVECMKAGADDYVMKNNIFRLASAVERELKEAKSARRWQRKSEKTLRESEGKYRSLFEHSRDAILLTSPDGPILDANPTACRMFGRSVEGIRRLGRSNLVDAADPRLHQALDELVRKDIAMSELTMLRANGDKFPVEVTSVVFDDGDGQFKTIMIIRDLTERKFMEEQLIQSRKLESLGQLAGGIVHDFNNMLGIILGNTEMAMDFIDFSHPLYANLKEIKQAAERSSDLTRQLLTFARRQVISPEVIDMNNAIEKILTMLMRLIGEDIELETIFQPGLWPVMVDTSQIYQIISNLCVNARDAIAGVGKITIETGNIRLDDSFCGELHGSEFFPGDYVVISITDNGCGMDRKTLEMVFEPFFTTKRAEGGTGLGLATVLGIVKENGGFIDVKSEPGRGSTFRIYLPRHADETEKAPLQETPSKATAKPPSAGHETVLIVEDEKPLLDMAELILLKEGYIVLAAGTPEEAIRLAGEYRGTIDLLLTDVIMPQMNGMDLAREITHLHPGIRCLFTSGYTANFIVQQGALADKDIPFMPKPFSRSDLIAKVRETLNSA